MFAYDKIKAIFDSAFDLYARFIAGIDRLYESILSKLILILSLATSGVATKIAVKINLAVWQFQIRDP